MLSEHTQDRGHYTVPHNNNGVVAGIRFFLSIAMVAADRVDFPNAEPGIPVTSALLVAYAAYSFLLFAATFLSRFTPHQPSTGWVWIDVIWYTALIAANPATNILFWLFLFAVLVASFQRGLREGVGITLFSAALFAAIVLIPDRVGVDWHRTLLRMTFLITIGLLIAYWGGGEITYRRRLALFKEVSFHGNFRFGVTQTIVSIMGRLQDYFGGDRCLVILHDPVTGRYYSRQLESHHKRKAFELQPIPQQLGTKLLALGPTCLSRSPTGFWSWLTHGFPSSVFDTQTNRWLEDKDGAAEAAKTLLDARSMVSAPFSTHRMNGRIFVSSRTRRYLCDDMFFLYDITLTAVSVVDTIDLIDRLASEAAREERRRIVGDVHDTAIQPYIGLRLGLEAIRRGLDQNDAMAEMVDNLMSMTTHAIDELRSCVAQMRLNTGERDNALISGALRHAQVVTKHYGIEVQVHANGEIGISDRLAAQALQIIKEALSNVRRHTCAKRADVCIAIEHGLLTIKVENERGNEPASDFIPHSITERSVALGGRAWVCQQNEASTAIRIEIPV